MPLKWTKSTPSAAARSTKTRGAAAGDEPEAAGAAAAARTRPATSGASFLKKDGPRRSIVPAASPGSGERIKAARREVRAPVRLLGGDRPQGRARKDWKEKPCRKTPTNETPCLLPLPLRHPRSLLLGTAVAAAVLPVAEEAPRPALRSPSHRLS